MPAFTTKSLPFWNRKLLGLEKACLLGFASFPWLGPMGRKPLFDFTLVPDSEVHRACGNGMGLLQVGSCLVWSLASMGPAATEKLWRMQTIDDDDEEL